MLASIGLVLVVIVVATCAVLSGGVGPWAFAKAMRGEAPMGRTYRRLGWRRTAQERAAYRGDHPLPERLATAAGFLIVGLSIFGSAFMHASWSGSLILISAAVLMVVIVRWLYQRRA